MVTIRNLFVTLPIHLLTGGLSLFLFLVFLKFFDHFLPVTMVSFFLFVINVMSYLLYSFFILSKCNWKEVISSTLLFLGIGLLLWRISFMTANDVLDTIFWIYHTVGYTSFVWYVESFIDPFIETYHHVGYLYSVIPSCLILVGYYLGEYLKR